MAATYDGRVDPERPPRVPTELRTDRLRLRRWRDGDRRPFAAMNADPEVMAMFPAPLRADESDALVGRIEAQFEERGFGLWAVEVPASGPEPGLPFVGFVGLVVPTFDMPFTPCVEIGWRLAREVWGRGYATEGAQEVLRCAFVDIGLAEVLSFTAVGNHRSRRVMQRIGMTHDPVDDFDHPSVPAGHGLERHVLYRITAVGWRARAAAAPSGVSEDVR